MNLLSFIAYILFVIISLEEDKKKKNDIGFTNLRVVWEK